MAIFNRMDELENKFLHTVDLEALRKETGLSLEELAEIAEIGPKVIYKWRYTHKDSSRPSYNAIVRLLEHGATVETLFGVDYAKTRQSDKTEPAADRKPLDLDSPEFQAAVKSAIVDLKTKGLI